MNKIENEYMATVLAGDEQTDSAYVTQVERHAFYFGPDNAPLFGWLHLPRNKPAGRMGMVLCPPLGIDYVNTYPVLRHLANRLAFHGIPVLRFDYSGTGNSCGFDVDADRVASWLRDIREARTTLSRVAGCREVGLFGVRIGALLAAAVAHDTVLPCLVLWGPVARGRAYVREMRAMHLTAEGPQLARLDEDSNIEAGGFVFTPQTGYDLAAISLDSLLPKTERILFAARDDLPSDQALPKSWVRAEQHTFPGFAGMLTSPHNSYYHMPFAAIDRFEQWIVDAAQITSPSVTEGGALQLTTMLRTVRFSGRPNVTQANVRESIVHFGEHGERFAIITEPLSGARPDIPWAILSSGGVDHTAGQNRLSLLLSRALAQTGMRCVRFDFPGVGDSVVAPPALENKTYQTTNSAEIASLIAALQREHGAQKFILMGLCSGAFASFHGGLELKQQPIVECLLFNPLTFYWDEGMSADDPPSIASTIQQRIEQHNLWQYYIGQMRDMRSWKNLLSAKSDVGQVVRATFHRARLALGEYLQGWTGRSTACDDDRLTRDVRALVASGRRLTFVFARSDPGYGLLMTHAGAVVRYYMRRKRVRIWFIDRTNHTFSSSAPRTEFINSVVNHLAQTYSLALEMAPKFTRQ